MDEQTTPPPEPAINPEASLGTGYPAVPTEPPPQEQRVPGMLCHLLALAGLTGIPFANILGPLIIWLVKKDQMAFVDDQGKESLNFQILVTIAIIASIPLWFICIGMIVTPVIGIAALVFVIIAAIKSNGGEYYRYPLNWRLIK